MAEEEEIENTGAEASEDEPTSDAPPASASDAEPTSEAGSAPIEGEADTPEEAALEPAVPAEAAAEALSPRQRKRQAKAAKAAQQPAKPPRSAEERQAERVTGRQRKAQVRRTARERARASVRTSDEPARQTPPREHQPGVQKTRQGVVVSDSPDKTIAVRIDITRRHREYKKIVRTSNTLHAHDERNDAHVGDTVVVRECRPLSRTKRWRLIEVVERAK